MAIPSAAHLDDMLQHVWGKLVKVNVSFQGGKRCSWIKRILQDSCPLHRTVLIRLKGGACFGHYMFLEVYGCYMVIIIGCFDR